MVQNVEQRESRPEGVQETPQVPEATKEKDHSLEVEGWVEKVERKQSQTQKPATDIQDDTKVTVSPPQTAQPAVTLPVTQNDMQVGATMPVTTAFRWLVEWVNRQIKKYKGNVAYHQQQPEGE